jgi:DNA polymerase-3 subunit delta'
MNDWVEEMAGMGREKLKSFFEYSIRMVRENFILNIKKTELIYLTADESEFSRRFHQYINGNNVVAIFEEMNKAWADIERNGYAKLVLFDFALRITKLIRNG